MVTQAPAGEKAPGTGDSTARKFLGRVNRPGETAFNLFVSAGGASGVGLLAAVTVIITCRAWPAFEQFGVGFLSGQQWNPVTDVYGALPLIYGTLASSLLALLIAAPLGLSIAIFLSEDQLPLRLRTAFGFAVELLAAIPSVIYGFWGIAVIIPITTQVGLWLFKHLPWIPLFSKPPSGPGLLPASFVLAIMILPTIAALSRSALRTVPAALKEGAYALGGTRWDVLLDISLPFARSGIVGAVVLALGRATGETMALAMLIGNSNRISSSILAPANTIASLLANSFGEASGLHLAALMYLSFILMVLTLLLNFIAQAFIRRSPAGAAHA